VGVGRWAWAWAWQRGRSSCFSSAGGGGAHPAWVTQQARTGHSQPPDDRCGDLLAPHPHGRSQPGGTQLDSGVSTGTYIRRRLGLGQPAARAVRGLQYELVQPGIRCCCGFCCEAAVRRSKSALRDFLVGGTPRGSLGPIALARPTIFAHLRRRLVASGCTVGRQLSPPPPGHSCSCLTHSFGFVALLAAALADAPCALFACRRYPTARPRSTGDNGG
jgi:hypothetical protein